LKSFADDSEALSLLFLNIFDSFVKKCSLVTSSMIAFVKGLFEFLLDRYERSLPEVSWLLLFSSVVACHLPFLMNVTLYGEIKGFMLRIYGRITLF
jgi:hypothetical protein